MPMKDSAPKSVLMVCLGNICRSPTAEEVLRQKAAVAGMTLKVDSAGTGDWHVGENPDPRAQKHAKARGYNISKLVARQVTQQDFYDFDLILAMDKSNLANLQTIRNEMAKQATDDILATLALMSEEDPTHCGQDVIDPYHGGEDGFEAVLDHIESSADAWINTWKK